jgi:hypothetical protein
MSFQDCLAVIPPYPFHLNPDAFDPATEMHSAMKVRAELFFRCKLKGQDSQEIPLELIYFSAFEPCQLTPDHVLQRAGIEMLYEPSPLPITYVGHVKHILGRTSLMPVFLYGNTTPTIPYHPETIRKQRQQFPFGKTDGKTKNDGTKTLGSKLYEVNMFLWQYGKGLPRNEKYQKAVDSRKRKREQGDAKRKKSHILRKTQAARSHSGARAATRSPSPGPGDSEYSSWDSAPPADDSDDSDSDSAGESDSDSESDST